MLWSTSAAGRSALTWALTASAGATPGLAEAAWTTRGPGASAGPAPSPAHVGTRARTSSSTSATTLPARARAAIGTIPNPSHLHDRYWYATHPLKPNVFNPNHGGLVPAPPRA